MPVSSVIELPHLVVHPITDKGSGILDQESDIVVAVTAPGNPKPRHKILPVVGGTYYGRRQG